MKRRAGQPFLTTDHMGNLHQVVVDNVGEMVGGQVVRAFVEHLVIDYIAHDAHVAADDVVDMHSLTRGDLETHHILRAVVDEGIHLLAG